MSPTSRDAKLEDAKPLEETIATSSAPVFNADNVRQTPPRARGGSQTSQLDRRRVRYARDPLALARLFRDYLGRDATTFAGIVYLFDGTKYVAMPKSDLERAIYRFLDEIRGAQPDRVATPNAANVREIIAAFKALTLLPTGHMPPCWKGDTIRRSDALVVCSNGILNLSTLQLQPATPELFTLTALDYPYEPSRKPPRMWLEFMGQVLADNPAAIDLIQEVFGCLLVPDTRHQKIFVLHGPRRSGKGTTLRVLTRLLGRSNVVATDLFTLGERFGLAPLVGRSVAIIGDAGKLGNSGRALQRLLSISGEDAVTIDRKMDDMWSGQLPTRFVVATNSIKDLSDPHGALASRLLAVPFRQSFVGREDPTMTDRLVAELPGILNWAIDGWDRLHRRGRFVVPTGCVLGNDMPADVAAQVSRFIEQCCDLDPTYTVLKEHLGHAWSKWREAHNLPPVSPARFGTALLKIGDGLIRSAKSPRSVQSRPPIYRGIRLRE